MFQAYKRENARPPTKMTSVVLNGPHTTGYSVCLDSRDMSLHVHKTDGPFSLCASPELRRPSGRWLYMPIAGDEWVSEVWLPSDSFQRSTLILITNTKRALVMGEHPRKGRGFSYKLITRLLNEPSLFYFDLSDGLREVALSVPLSQKAAIPELCLPKPASAYPQCLPTEDFFFSAASLETCLK
ncbi:hypothetical protein J3459_013696 [Metarhizium acridum]|nr:hypothetical protein J3459_013696 [Metarhizium acridum]